MIEIEENKGWSGYRDRFGGTGITTAKCWRFWRLTGDEFGAGDSDVVYPVKNEIFKSESWQLAAIPDFGPSPTETSAAVADHAPSLAAIIKARGHEKAVFAANK